MPWLRIGQGASQIARHMLNVLVDGEELQWPDPHILVLPSVIAAEPQDPQF